MLEKNVYGLTGPQKNIWNTELFFNNSNVNNVCASGILHEALDFDLLKQALNILVKENDSFRVRIQVKDNVPVQYFSDFVPFDVDILNANNKKDFAKIEQETVSKKFNILDSDLFLFKLVRFPDSTGGIILNVHHIISDSWSLGLVIQEIIKIYHALKANIDYVPDTFSYIEYINSEEKYKSSKRYLSDKEFWSDYLSSLPEPVTIPGLVTSTSSSRGNRLSYTIDKKTCNLINEYCRSNSISNYVFFMSIFALYIANISDSLDFIIGTPILNRTNFKEKNTIGMFVETVPFRFSLDISSSFKELSSKTSLNLMSLLRHQKYSYTDMLEDLRKQDNNIPNLYNIAISYQITKAFSSDIGDYETNWAFNNNSLNDMNIHIYDINDTGSLQINYDYLIDKYAEKDIEFLHLRILNIIKQVLNSANNLKLSDIKVITDEEFDQLNKFNNYTLNYSTATVNELISEAADKYPNNIAVVDNNRRITYSQLENYSNIIANILIKNNIKSNEIVGIYMPEKNIDLICSALGILKTGSAFLGIYNEYPLDRIIYMLKDSNSKCLIVDDLNNPNVKAIKTAIPNILLIETNSLDFSKKLDFKINTKIDLDSNAYIIYTSGSTGKPKGVSLSHKNLINFVYSFREHLQGVDITDRFISVTNICFDVSMSEIFTPLFFGASLYLYKDLNYSTPKELAEYITKNEITFSYFPPALLSHVCNELKKLDGVKLCKMLVGVEPIKAATLSEFLKINPNMRIVNGYGPTETTICCTMYDFDNTLPADSIVPIGMPLYNNHLYVFNKFMNYLPINYPGILWVSGDNVGNGYIGQAKNTTDTYKVFNSTNFYNTGDLVKWDENGVLHFIGRKDNQIKFHGYRIDLGEIEAAIKKFENVSNCFVLSNKTNEVDRLVAFITSHSIINEFDIRTFISNILPHYMIPSEFIFLDTFPLTPNGKIDKKALLELANVKFNSSKDNVKPSSPLENTLANIFSSVLGISQISVNDNFFELGGDSLNAIKLIAKIEEELHMKILIKDIFSFPTVASMAKYIDQYSSKSEKRTITPTTKEEFYPISFAQKRIYYTVKLNENSIVYNTPFGIIFDKMPDTLKLEACFNTIINTNQALRTYFDIENGEVVQKVKDKIDFKLDVVETENKSINEIFDDFVQPFDLNTAPLFRAKFVKSGNIYILLVDMHHIICDGQSANILADKLCKLYNDTSIEKNDIDYIDFVVWERKNSQTEEFEKSKEFWVNNFKGELPVLNMPLQKTRPKVQSFRGNKIYDKIEDTAKLYELCKNLNVTPYMLLLSLYYVLLYKYTGQDEFVVGSPITGRDNIQTSNIIGMFVNTLPLKATVNKNTSFHNLLSQVMNNCIRAFENQLYPFDELVKELDIPRDSSTTPIFSTMFTFQNTGVPSLELNGLNVKYYIPDNKTAKFDFSLEISPIGNDLDLNLEYCIDLFDKEFMQDFLKHYINIYNYILNNDMEVLIKDIPILSKEEENSLIYEYNDTYIEYPRDKTIIQLFEKQVKETPNKTAIIFNNKSITYKELNKKANQIAYYLRENGIKPNNVVGIMVNRSFELIACMLGILKSGAAYLPIDPTYPQERINYIIKDSNVNILLTLDNLINNINIYSNAKVLPVNFDTSAIYNLPDDNLDTVNKPEDLAYLIYTSGSTGNPKGVMLTHRNVNNFIEATCKEIEFENIIVSVTTFCFDIFVLESLLPLQKGLTIVLANEEEQNIPQRLNELCNANNVQMLQTTPARMSLLLSDKDSLEYIKNLKVIMLGGEPFPQKLLEELKRLTEARIYNMYGPTETTVWSSIKELTNTSEITIGKPMGNTQFYILDNDNNLLSAGMEGHLFIGGDGVGNGYLHRVELTKEKFINNPYKENDIIYDTGDMAKWNNEKEAICLGRSDFQVKLHGLRIELSEIENRIVQFPNISKAVVCVKKDNLERDFLCAYFVSKSRISTPALKDFLSKFLPTYMVPNKFKQLSDFKYTPNGKIDKKALPEIRFQTKKDNIELPKTATEKKLSKIYEELLSISPISINDNFFEIGGDSMLALKLQIKLLNDNINITYADIFKYPTIRQLANKLDTNIENNSISVENYDFSNIHSLIKVNSIENIENIPKLEKREIGNIILTGATGFLGAHILSHILDNTNLKVYCLLRPDLSIDINTKLLKRLQYYFGNKYDKLMNIRIFAISSDITSEGLGLNIDTLTLLNKEASCVINSAAIVKHYGDYSDFEKINVNGVKNLINFCIKNNKELIQISTTSVSGNTLFDLAIDNNNFKEDIEFNETNFYIGQSLENVYVRSKFEAEKIIFENMFHNNLRALILRIGNITNRSTDGKFQPNASENAFLNRLKAFLELKCVPNYLKNIYIEFSPVDKVAEAIYKAICYSNKFNVFHIYNPNHIYMEDLVQLLPENKLTFVEDEVFDKKLHNFMKKVSDTTSVSYLINDLNKDQHINYDNYIKIKNDFTTYFLNKSNFRWNKIDKDYIEKLLKNF